MKVRIGGRHNPPTYDIMQSVISRTSPSWSRQQSFEVRYRFINIIVLSIYKQTLRPFQAKGTYLKIHFVASNYGRGGAHEHNIRGFFLTF